MQSCEVAIVGAGPAGSTCARLLSESGLSVLLLDRDPFPREKPCAGWLTPAVFQTLGVDPQEYRAERLLQEIREFRTGIMYGDQLVTDYAHTVSYGIRRCEFDDLLLKRSNTPQLLGEPVVKLERLADGWLINGKVKAGMVIGAGGHHCPVARALGAAPGSEKAITAVVAEVELGGEQLERSGLAAGSVALYFTRDLQGYGWLFRKGDFLNVGLGSLESHDLRREAERLCAHLARRFDLPEDPTRHLKGHAYLPYQTAGGRTRVGDRALLIGDAAGLSAPESGEGILQAVESAVLAARTVIAAGGDYREEKLQPYGSAITARFGGGKTASFPQALKRGAGSLILASRWLTKRLVLDQWFLHRHRPVLDWGAWR
jgi:menaquinone-9 beta-reductase